MWLYPSLSKTDKPITALLKVSAAVIKIHDQKQLGKERVYFSLQFSNYTPSLREVRTGPQSKNLVVRTEGKTSEKCCLLACSLWLAQPAFLYTQKWYRPQWGGALPTSITKKISPTDLPMEESYGDIFSINITSQVCLSLSS